MNVKRDISKKLTSESFKFERNTNNFKARKMSSYFFLWSGGGGDGMEDKETVIEQLIKARATDIDRQRGNIEDAQLRDNLQLTTDWLIAH